MATTNGEGEAPPAPAGVEMPVTVRATSGQSRDDGWVRHHRLPWRQRLLEAGRFAVIGLVGGSLLIFVPLIHLVGLAFALVLLGIAAMRLRHADVLAAAGGVCPRCGAEGTFFVGLGRRQFRLPTGATCGDCGVDLTLSPVLPSSPPEPA